MTPSNPAQSETLLPCPHCGSARVSIYDDGSYWENPKPLPNCRNCGATAPTAEAWNTRSLPEPQQGVVVTEAMVEAGYAIMCQSPSEAGCDYKALLGRAYLAMRAKAMQVPELPKWEGIESAPKDGTSVLLATELGVLIGSWGRGRYLGKVKGYEPAWGCGSAYGWEPTHWMPLPPAPGGEQ